jgi:hypothetical protein
MELTFAEVADVNRGEKPRLCRCVDGRGYALGSCSVCDAAVGSPAFHRALAEACSRPNKARSPSARSAKAKVISRTVSREGPW